jgi:hypothetical protein
MAENCQPEVSTAKCWLLPSTERKGKRQQEDEQTEGKKCSTLQIQKKAVPKLIHAHAVHHGYGCLLVY